jgi:hypothetical protein
MTDHHIADTPPPTDPELTAGMLPTTAWRAGGIMVVLVLTLAALFPAGVVNVVQSLPEHALTDPLIPAAYAWQDWMTAAGIVDAYDAIKGAFESLRQR